MVRSSPDLVVAPGCSSERAVAGPACADGWHTVSALREAFGTSRKYAVPLAEWLDRTGVTRRDGDLRFPRPEPAG